VTEIRNPMTTDPDPIQRLADLVSRRSVRTDQLHEAVRALLAKLERFVEFGAPVRVDSCSLERVTLRSRVGHRNYWKFTDCGNHWYLDDPVGDDGYLHGDFSVPVRGPTRKVLIEFGRTAPRFLQAILRREEAAICDLDEATSGVTRAIAALEAHS
jgi:hypothetical protein